MEVPMLEFINQFAPVSFAALRCFAMVLITFACLVVAFNYARRTHSLSRILGFYADCIVSGVARAVTLSELVRNSSGPFRDSAMVEELRQKLGEEQAAMERHSTAAEEVLFKSLRVGVLAVVFGLLGFWGLSQCLSYLLDTHNDFLVSNGMHCSTYCHSVEDPPLRAAVRSRELYPPLSYEQEQLELARAAWRSPSEMDAGVAAPSDGSN